MNYNKRTTCNIEDNFLLNLLKDRGVLPTNPQEIDKFINPTIDNEYNPELLDHMEEGFQLLCKHLSAGGRIYLIVD